MLPEGEAMTNLHDLDRLASLLNRRNKIEVTIAEIIGRPAERGHIAEYVASEIFDIELHESATHKGSDGVFRDGPLSGQTVNIKSYGKREGILDIALDDPPDFYLVLTGPRAPAATSRGSARPWTILSVFLFDHHELVNQLTVKIGTATSIRSKFWDAAEVFPIQSSNRLILTPGQRSMIEKFGIS